MALSDQVLIRRLTDAALRGRVVRLMPNTALRLAEALRALIGMDRALPPRRVHPVEDEMPFAVQTWTADGNRVLETMARARNLLVARAAYQAATRERPQFLLTLRNGTHVIEWRDPDPPTPVRPAA